MYNFKASIPPNLTCVSQKEVKSLLFFKLKQLNEDKSLDKVISLREKKTKLGQTFQFWLTLTWHNKKYKEIES